MQEKTKQKFSYAVESVKQLITLSTAILTLTVAFKEKVFPSQPWAPSWLLVLALIIHVISIYYGVKSIQGIVNILEIANDEDDPSVFIPEIKRPAEIQLKAFMIGLGLLIAYLVVSLLAAWYSAPRSS